MTSPELEFTSDDWLLYAEIIDVSNNNLLDLENELINH